MMNRNERMESLKNAGVDTSKYFNVSLPNGLAPGATISLVINENGEPVIVSNTPKNDAISEQIIADGYVRNTKLHRRFVMAQMFHILNYVSYRGTDKGYNDCLRNMYGYDYTLKMMLEEVKVLSKLEVRDKESFDERSHFFTKAVIVDVLEDYLEKLIKYIDTFPNKNCKGVPYKKVKGVNIFVEDLDKKIYMPIRFKISDVRRARNYNEIYKILSGFMKNAIKLPYSTPKSKEWIDAYKGEGAYYTLKNLVMYHDCVIYGCTCDYTGQGAVNYIKARLDDYSGEGWRMFALMKKVIADNKFDFNKRMEELGK